MCTLYNVHKEYLFCTQILCISKYNSLATVQRIDCTQYTIHICCMLCVKCLVYELYTIQDTLYSRSVRENYETHRDDR